MGSSPSPILITPTLLLFWSSIILRILFILSSSSFFIAWLALELNTLAFIPFLLQTKTNSGEAALKYFLSQTLGSIIFVFSLIGLTLCNESLTRILFTSALILKLGAAPLHAWLPAIVGVISWERLFLILTVQKFNPLLLLSHYFYSSTFFVGMGILSLIVGSLVGLLQTQVRIILTYSSINQMGWIILALWASWRLIFTYYVLYTILLLPVIILAKQFNLNKLRQLISNKLSFRAQTLFFLNLLSLGGLPPFLGFLPKWLVLSQLITSSQFLSALIIVLTSLLTLYYYLRITYNSFLINTNQWNFLTFTVSPSLVWITQINLISLWLGILV